MTTTNPSRSGTGAGSFFSVFSLLLCLRLVHSSLFPYLAPANLPQSHVQVFLISTTGNINVPWHYTLCSPAMLHEELSTDMDRITQLQDAILDLLTITSTSIEYITKRTQFEQTSISIPTTLSTPNAANRVEYKAAIETFVADIVRRSKDIQHLIDGLPKPGDSSERAKRLIELQDEIKIANEEYKQVLKQSKELVNELQLALDHTLGESPKDISIQPANYPAGIPYHDQTQQ
ncbi:hypothetical protein J007_06718 [Cryptococcus neoformans]|nr:hypothetical protein J007_06718 [Cryptococcus neoformans var. grubii]OXC57757.1 hypothetical protein C358_06812 [Cryptococcus neoformans var. grubii MW-RSA852]